MIIKNLVELAGKGNVAGETMKSMHSCNRKKELSYVKVFTGGLFWYSTF